MGYPVVHFEINTSDGPSLATFYAELFGWHLETMPEMSYTVVDTHGEGINGGIGTSEQGQFVTFYVEVPDPQAALDKAETLGAKTVVPVTEIPNVVTFALFADPQGNTIGVVKGDGSQAPETGGDNPGVGWFEVLGPDAKALWKFYRELFGWTIKEGGGEGFLYGEVDTGAGRGIPGGIGSGPQGEPHVTVYAGVPDVQAFLTKAESLGGKTARPVTDVGEGTTIAAINDPQGNVFGLFRHVHPH